MVTCVKLKYVQRQIEKRLAQISFDRPRGLYTICTTEAVVSFLSEDVDTCVNEFLERMGTSLQKMVVIAREGMSLR